MDEDRRRQIEEEERYRAEIRAKFEREDQAEPPRIKVTPATTEKPKKRGGGCLRSIFIGILILVGLAFIGNLLPDTESDETSAPSQNAQPAASQPRADPPASTEPETAPAVEPENTEPVSVENSSITLPSGETIDFISAKVLCESLVKDQLVSPRSAKFPGVWSGNTEEPIKIANSWAYNVVVDSENSFGAMLRSNWLCTLNGDDNSSSVTQVE